MTQLLPNKYHHTQKQSAWLEIVPCCCAYLSYFYNFSEGNSLIVVSLAKKMSTLWDFRMHLKKTKYEQPVPCHCLKTCVWCAVPCHKVAEFA
jgi:hypothetical protein